MGYPQLLSNPPLIGVIGGSGLYSLDNLTVERTLGVVTPWGSPSSPVTIATIATASGPISVAFISRHSPHHSIPPSKVPNRANIAALKHLGVKAIVAFSAVGSLREEVRPGDIVVPDQVIDRTKGIRASTFFDGEMVGHAMFGDPFSVALTNFIIPQIQSAIASFPHASSNVEDHPRLHEKKTLVVMEGPQFSSRAESNMYRLWGGDIINMSSLPEAKLAREAELSYALVCTSTDYDAWRVGSAPVTVEEVMKTLHTNAALSKHITASILEAVHHAVAKGEVGRDAEGGMKWSLMTGQDHITKEEKYKLKYLLPQYFPDAEEPKKKGAVQTEDNDDLTKTFTGIKP